MVNIELFREFYVKNIPAKLQHNAGKFGGVTMFIMQLELELHLNLKKVA